MNGLHNGISGYNLLAMLVFVYGVSAVEETFEEVKAAQQSAQADGATLCEHGKGHCQCDNTRCRNYCD